MAGVDTILDYAGVVTRVGDETVGEMWSLAYAEDGGQDQPGILREHRQARSECHVDRPVPRLGEHRPQGRPVKVAPGTGSRRTAARRERERPWNRGARSEVRNRGGVFQPGLRPADHR